MSDADEKNDKPVKPTFKPFAELVVAALVVFLLDYLFEELRPYLQTLLSKALASGVKSFLKDYFTTLLLLAWWTIATYFTWQNFKKAIENARRVGGTDCRELPRLVFVPLAIVYAGLGLTLLWTLLACPGPFAQWLLLCLGVGHDAAMNVAGFVQAGCVISGFFVAYVVFGLGEGSHDGSQRLPTTSTSALPFESIRIQTSMHRSLAPLVT